MDYLTVPFEVKSGGAGDRAGVVSGYGSVFGNLDLQGDIVQKGAFTETIRENPKGWPMLFGHDMRRQVGFWTHAREDSKGLYLDGEFTMDTPEGASAYALVRHGARLGQPFGMSIGYMTRKGGSRDVGNQRHLTDLSVLEVSLATVPANQLARVTAVKSAAVLSDLAECKTPGEVCRLLRSAGGMSRKQAGDWLLMMRTGEDEPEELDDEPEPFAKQLRMAVKAAEEREIQLRELVYAAMEATIKKQVDAKVRPDAYCHTESLSAQMAEWKSSKNRYIDDYPGWPLERVEAQFLAHNPIPRKDCVVFDQGKYNEARQVEAKQIVDGVMEQLAGKNNAGIDQMLGNWHWAEKHIGEFIKLREF